MADDFTTEREFAQYGGGLRDDWIALLEFDNISTANSEGTERIRIYDEEDIVIGRDDRWDNDDHSELPPLVYCEDLESVNGTYVNGTLIGILGREKVGHLLCDGDVIEIHPYWKFTFRQPLQQQASRSNDQEKDIQYFNNIYSVTNLVLGSGRNGTVYLANEINTSRQLACKVISLRVSDAESLIASRPASRKTTASRREKAKENKRTVLREVEMLSKLSHPNIINLKKAFCSDCALYIFTDLAPAGDLFSYLDSQNGTLDDYHGRVITRQVALAIQYIHSMGIAHRDIKPENILVTHTDFGSRVVLTDFGFARYTSTGTKSGRMSSILGTLTYIAPEIDDRRKEDVAYTMAVDMWSFGTMTAFLLTGRHHIPRQSMLDMTEVQLAAHFLEVDEQQIVEKWRKVSPRAQRFVRRLLVVNAEHRMTADEAVNHSWYKRPSREAVAMEEGYKRVIRFWKPREAGENIVEDIPGRVTRTVKDVTKPRRKVRDASSSPYFGLDRHLTPRSPSKRKRMLADLKELGATFLSPELYDFEVLPPQPKIGVPRDRRTVRFISVDGGDLFGKTLDAEYHSGNETSLEDVNLVPTTPIPQFKKTFGFNLSDSIDPVTVIVESQIDSADDHEVPTSKRARKESDPNNMAIHEAAVNELPRFCTALQFGNMVTKLKEASRAENRGASELVE